ncbi:hypothetical protein JCM17823_08410 [Halorubrum gandharaense]
MATEDPEDVPADSPDDGEPAGAAESPASGGGATVGSYSWREFLREHGHADAVEALYAEIGDRDVVDEEDVVRRVEGSVDDAELAPTETTLDADAVVGETPDEDDAGDTPERVVAAERDVYRAPERRPTAADWDRAGLDPADFLGFDPDDLGRRLWAGDLVGDELFERWEARYDPYSVPVLKDYYTWDDYEAEFHRDEDGELPTTEDEDGNEVPVEFTHEDKTEALGFDPDRIENALAFGAAADDHLVDVVDERTVDVNPELDEDAFFSTPEGHTTLANRYDLEKAVPMEKKRHFREEERYWVNEPYAFIVIFHSTKENEKKYYAIQPYMTAIDADLQEFLTGKLRTSIKYSDESIAGGDEEFRAGVIADETHSLLERYDLYEHDAGDDGGIAADLVDRFEIDPDDGIAGRIAQALGYEPPTPSTAELSGVSARPEPAVLEEDRDTLTEYQVEKLLYYLKRDFIGYERIDPIKYDINVEDISCDGYNAPVFVYHSDYEQIITNVYHGTDELDDFVVKLAQRSGKGISKRRPQVDATLPDGSRAQLTLGKEVSDHGTNYTIRQFKDVPFTPVDLVNWKTFSLDEMAFLWLCIENHKSLIFAGGTASGKTTSLNAVSLFIPSNAKIVSIEDTREVELPQRNWIASVTRPSFSDDDKGDVDEFDLLEAALRQRPDYIVMGEIRGEEGRTAFQVMSTGHTTYTTFHADSVGEVLKRFTTDPINVSKTMFTALDLVSIQASTRVQGKKVRRNKSLTEINHYDAENDEINVQDVYQWQAETDEFLQMGDSNTLEEIMFDRGWNRSKLDEELRKRQLVLAYLIDRGLNSYAQVAATFQAFINDPETILALLANDGLERSLEDLREMESVLINVDPEKEKMVPRPDPDEEGREEAERILRDSDDLLEEYRGSVPDSVADALVDVPPAADVEARPDEPHETLEETAQEAEAVSGEVAGAEPAESAGSAGSAEAAGPAEPESGVDDGTTDTPDGTAGVDADEASSGGPPGLDAAATDEADGTVPSEEADGSGIDFDEPFGQGIDVTQGVDVEDSSAETEESAVDPADVDEPDPFVDPEPEDAGGGGEADGGDGDDEAGGAEDTEDTEDTEDAEDAEDADNGDATETDADESEARIDEWGFGEVEDDDA